MGGAEVVKREPEDLRKSISPTERVLLDRRRMVLVPSSAATTTSTPNTTTARLDPHTKEILEAQIIKEESLDRPRISQATYCTTSENEKMTSGYVGFPATGHNAYDPVSPYVSSSSPGVYTTSAPVREPTPGPGYAFANDPYYPSYIRSTSENQYNTDARIDYANPNEQAFDRYPRASTNYKSITVDSSPDSGTSSDPGIPREHGLFQPQVRECFFHVQCCVLSVNCVFYCADPAFQVYREYLTLYMFICNSYSSF